MPASLFADLSVPFIIGVASIPSRTGVVAEGMEEYLLACMGCYL